MTYFCSYQLAKRTIDAYRYGLKHLMNHYKLDFHGHHDALNDAKACAMITFRLLKHYDDLPSMLNIYGKNLKDKRLIYHYVQVIISLILYKIIYGHVSITRLF